MRLVPYTAYDTSTGIAKPTAARHDMKAVEPGSFTYTAGSGQQQQTFTVSATKVTLTDNTVIYVSEAVGALAAAS